MPTQLRPEWHVPLLKFGLAGVCLGLLLVAIGIGYGAGCNFDTMNTCRPFGLWGGDAFTVVGVAGLTILAGLIVCALGGLLTLICLARPKP
jgi:hypothetical protein